MGLPLVTSAVSQKPLPYVMVNTAAGIIPRSRHLSKTITTTTVILVKRGRLGGISEMPLGT
jgi:hypothetical protein